MSLSRGRINRTRAEGSRPRCRHNRRNVLPALHAQPPLREPLRDPRRPARPASGRACAGPLGVRCRRGDRAERGHHAPADHRARAPPGRLRQRPLLLPRALVVAADRRPDPGSAPRRRVRRRRAVLAHPGRVRGQALGRRAAAPVGVAGSRRRGDAPRTRGARGRAVRAIPHLPSRMAGGLVSQRVGGPRYRRRRRRAGPAMAGRAVAPPGRSHGQRRPPPDPRVAAGAGRPRHRPGRHRQAAGQRPRVLPAHDAAGAPGAAATARPPHRPARVRAQPEPGVLVRRRRAAPARVADGARRTAAP